MAKLVAIGDSLVQGAGSMAVSDTRNSFPAIVAKCLGLSGAAFLSPDFSGAGGLPCNFEWMARNLERRLGHHIRGPEWIAAAVQAGAMLDEVEDYWERGPGTHPGPDVLYHNLGIFGFQVCDALLTNAHNARERIGRSRDNLFQPPSFGWLRIAERVLNPAGTPSRMGDSQLDVMDRIASRDGGIENLLICTGANNCLNAIFRLEVIETGDASPGSDSVYTVWSARAFRQEFEALAERVAACAPDYVFVATVPHVNSMPIVQGIMANGGQRPEGRDYWDYYTPVWMDPAGFNRERDRFITGLEARGIEERVDEYNDIIRGIADARGWHIVDICRLTDDLSWDRHRGHPVGVLPPAIHDLDSRFMKLSDDGQIRSGGLVSLDGMHPTLCGYGLFAQAFVNAIRATGQSIADVDFAALRTSDQLVENPPTAIRDSFGLLTLLERHFHLSRWLRLNNDYGFQLRR